MLNRKVLIGLVVVAIVIFLSIWAVAYVSNLDDKQAYRDSAIATECAVTPTLDYCD